MKGTVDEKTGKFKKNKESQAPRASNAKLASFVRQQGSTTSKEDYAGKKKWDKQIFTSEMKRLRNWDDVRINREWSDIEMNCSEDQKSMSGPPECP